MCVCVYHPIHSGRQPSSTSWNASSRTTSRGWVTQMGGGRSESTHLPLNEFLVSPFSFCGISHTYIYIRTYNTCLDFVAISYTRKKKKSSQYNTIHFTLFTAPTTSTTTIYFIHTYILLLSAVLSSGGSLFHFCQDSKRQPTMMVHARHKTAKQHK